MLEKFSQARLVDWLVEEEVHASGTRVLLVSFALIRCDAAYIGMIFLRNVLLTQKLLDLDTSLNTCHHRHAVVHEDQAIGCVRLLESFYNYVDGFLPICYTIRIDA